MRVLSVLVCMIVAVGSGTFAAPDTSLRPVARALSEPQIDTPLFANIRPTLRPALLETALASRLEKQLTGDPSLGFETGPNKAVPPSVRAFAALSKQATGLSLRPLLRPDEVVRKAMAQRQKNARGAVCGDTAIQGEVVGFVPGRISGCGIKDAVRVRSVSGITLSQQAVLDCTTAKALKQWINKGMKPAVGDFGGGVSQIRVAAHYACRTRNNQAGARISEHGRGRAIDIAGFRFKDGSEITVLEDWGRRGTGAILRDMHKRACGVFGTVLGPQSDRFHQDHFHFDTARHRGGAYCR
jgi:hypothetical protein